MLSRYMVTELRRPGYRCQLADRIGSATRVRHFDQLSEPAQNALVAATDGGTGRLPSAEFEPGEVVIFTDYYRVQAG